MGEIIDHGEWSDFQNMYEDIVLFIQENPSYACLSADDPIHGMVGFSAFDRERRIGDPDAHRWTISLGILRQLLPRIGPPFGPLLRTTAGRSTIALSTSRPDLMQGLYRSAVPESTSEDIEQALLGPPIVKEEPTQPVKSVWEWLSEESD